MLRIYKEIVREIVRVLEEESDCSEQQILTCKNDDCVIMRSVIVQLLLNYGLTERNISEVTTMKQQTINGIKNRADFYSNIPLYRYLYNKCEETIKKQIKHL